MLKSKITKRFQQMILKYAILMGIPMVFFGVLFIVIPQYSQVIAWVMLGILLIDSILFSFKIKGFYLSYKGMKVAVTQIDSTIPFPEKLKINAIRPLKSNLNAYGYKDIQIPKTFIQSRIDRHYHLYPKLDQIHTINQYKLIVMSEFKYALIEDSNRKRWIASLSCLEEKNPTDDHRV